MKENTQIDVKSLAEQIKKQNRKGKGQWLEAVFAVLSIVFLADMLFQDESALGYVLFLCYGVVFTAFAADAWCNRFLYYDTCSKEKIDNYKKILTVFRYHAFPIREYFAVIRNRLWMLSLYVVVIFFESGLHMGGWKRTTGILFAVVAAICPYLVWWLKKEIWIKKMERQEESIGKQILEGVGIVCKWIFGRIPAILSFFVAAVFGGIIVYALVMSLFERGRLDDQVAMREVYQSAYGFVFFSLPFVAFFANLQWGYAYVSKTWKRCKLVIGIVFVMGMFASMIFDLNAYTLYYPDQIEIHNFGTVKKYQNEDIADFVIYESEDEMQMELIMKDGKELKLARGTASDSEMFTKSYSGNVNWFLSYVEELRARGINGKIENVNALDQYVEELSAEEKDGWIKIKKAMEIEK